MQYAPRARSPSPSGETPVFGLVFSLAAILAAGFGIVVGLSVAAGEALGRAVATGVAVAIEAQEQLDDAGQRSRRQTPT